MAFFQMRLSSLTASNITKKASGIRTMAANFAVDASTKYASTKSRAAIKLTKIAIARWRASSLMFFLLKVIAFSP